MTTMTITSQDTLGDLATRLPAASRIFQANGLDFCCGGGRTLAEACSERGLDPTRILGAIEDAAPTTAAASVRWDLRPVNEVIDHILVTYHEPLRRELPELVALARKVEVVHAEKASCPRGLAHHLEDMAASLLSHMEKEEQVLFPMIRNGHGPMAAMPVRVMMQEHEDHGENLQETRRLTTDLTPPSDACITWRALYLRLADLESSLMDHVHLENHVLFPRALRESDPTSVPQSSEKA